MSSVYSDPFSRPKPRFEKGDTVHFNDVQSSVRRKRTAQITNLRLTNNGYYEYQLLLEKGKGGFHGSEPNKNGQWVREKDLKLEKRAGIPASTKSNLEATHRQDIGKNRTRNSKVLAADKSANGPTRRKLTLSDYLSRRAKLAQMQSLGTSATPPITQSHPTSSSPVLGDKPPPLSLASTIYASVSREQQAAFIDPPPSPSADFPSELDESEGVYSSELSTLKCICSSSDNDGNTVRCEECNTSQHIKCYYESMVDPPIVHRCFDCSQGTFRSIRTVVERVDPQQLVTDHINNTYSPGERLLGNRKSISPPPSMQALPIPRFMTKDSTVDPSILSYSDSGYASVDPKSNKEWETVEFKNSISSDDNDTMSLYSVDPTPDAAKEAYIRELANDLMNQIVKEAESVDGILIDKICTELHRDLQAFARMTGDLGRSQEARDVMVFVSQHRQKIIANLRAGMEVHRTDSEDRVNFSDVEQNYRSIEAWLDDDNSWGIGIPTDLFEGVPEDNDDERDDINGLPHYRDTITNSTAYKWLISKLHNVLDLMPTQPNTMGEISDYIHDSFAHKPQFRQFSRATNPHICDMEFIVDWDPLIFLEEQSYDGPPEEVIARALTLTGTMENAQALTVEQYLKQTWHKSGEEVLALVQKLVKSGERRQPNIVGNLSNGVALNMHSVAGAFILNAVGTLEAISELGEIVSWMGSALRSSPPDGDVVYCFPVIRGMAVGQQSKTSTKARFHMRFQLEAVKSQDSTPGANGTCWRALFCNPVVVKGYPIRRRATTNTGLEISLDIMATLFGSRRITKYAERITIKRFSGMLFLSDKMEDTLIWHLLFNGNGEHLSYNDSRVCQGPRIAESKPSMETLLAARHIVGWCSNVRNFVGAPDANYNIEWSRLPKPNQRCAFEKVSISAGKFIQAGVQVALGKRDKAMYIKSRDDYISQLKWLEKKFVVLHDLEDRRAYLVDGITTLLHLVRASLESDLHDIFNEHFKFRPEQLQEAGSGRDGKAAAIAVLTNMHNQNLELYKKPVETCEEITYEDTADVKEVRKEVSKITTRYLRFKDRVESIYHLLEQIMAYQSQVNSEDGVGFRIKKTPRRQLEGFDFMDLASDEDPFWPRVATLKATGAGWVDLARALHAITLFGHGFGELLRPVNIDQQCSQWRGVPKDKDYLAIPVSLMADILRKKGNVRERPWRLVYDIYWTTPDKVFETCDCSETNSSKSGCDRVQVLISSNFPKWYPGKPKSPATLQGSGAILIGHSRKFPLRWGDHGDPEMENLSTAIDQSLGLDDSGLGSSIATSSTSATSSETGSESRSSGGSGEAQGKKRKMWDSWPKSSKRRK